MKLALEVEIGPRLGTCPRSESYIYITCVQCNVKKKTSEAKKRCVVEKMVTYPSNPTLKFFIA